MTCLFSSISPPLFQLVKKQIWRSHSLKNDSTSCLSSIVLDASDELPHQKSLKDNRFIYRFVHRDLLSINVKASGGDPLSVASSPTNDMDCTLRSGDYVVQLITWIRFGHDVTFAEFTLHRTIFSRGLTWIAPTLCFFLMLILFFTCLSALIDIPIKK